MKQKFHFDQIIHEEIIKKTKKNKKEKTKR